MYNKATCLKTISKSRGNNLNIINFLVGNIFSVCTSIAILNHTADSTLLKLISYSCKNLNMNQAKLFTPYNQVQDFLFGLPLVAYSYFIFLSDRILLWVLHIRRITLCLGCQNLIACFKCSLKRKSHWPFFLGNEKQQLSYSLKLAPHWLLDHAATWLQL